MAEKSPELGFSMNVVAHQVDGRRLQSMQTQKPGEPDFSGDLPAVEMVKRKWLQAEGGSLGFAQADGGLPSGFGWW